MGGNMRTSRLGIIGFCFLVFTTWQAGCEGTQPTTSTKGEEGASGDKGEYLPV